MVYCHYVTNFRDASVINDPVEMEVMQVVVDLEFKQCVACTEVSEAQIVAQRVSEDCRFSTLCMLLHPTQQPFVFLDSVFLSSGSRFVLIGVALDASCLFVLPIGRCFFSELRLCFLLFFFCYSCC